VKRGLPFFAFVGFGASNDGIVVDKHRWERDEDAIACIGLDIVLNADMVLYDGSYYYRYSDHRRRFIFLSDVAFCRCA
jgi:hypothetical protein